MGNVLTFTPSLVTTRNDMDFALNVIDESLTEVEKELGYA
jgi:4-aminobutyrate aminotransferase